MLLLAMVPVIAGTARLHELASHAPVTAANARFFAAPLPIVVHLAASLVFAVLGAFQFVTGIRWKWPAWHRMAGRLLVVCGLLAALSGVWMAVFYTLPPSDGEALKVIRLAVGTAMIVSILLALAAIRRGDVATHSAWMTRAYAVGMGAGTQVLTHLPYFVLVGGMPDPVVRAWLMGAGWGINLAVAEIVNLRRRRAARLRLPGPSGRW
ncbi:DUF2306 domain-containing protein [Asticcacaulis solisilvae]|uniref:DUF2306 domain-containing protein n=1 Tax=Asticcacaulis solisilvae TaxID=1217274 RepID=UPI003FD8657F